VKNQAPPIPLETMPRLFEPFRRSSKGTKSGVGLGLFITKGIVDAHGGKIQVESSERGTTFRVHLPR
jgi:signal transduction histidine kinase